MCFEMSSSDKVDDAKAKHEEKTKVPKGNVSFFWRDEELDSAMGLDDLKVKAGSNNITVEVREGVNVKVTMMKGNEDSFAMQTTDTILDVKKKLQKQEGVDTHCIKLMMNG